MADWLWVESPGSTLQQQPRVREARFGDGYAQRAPDGINFQPQVWELNFEDVDDEIGDEMIGFLRVHGGYKPFNFHPLYEPAPIKVICDQWRRSLGNRVKTSTITCTFTQDFAPGGFEPGLQGNARLDGPSASGGGSGGSGLGGDAALGGPAAGGGLAGNISTLAGNATEGGVAAGGSLQPEGLLGDAELAGPSAGGGMASAASPTFTEGYLVKLTFETYTAGAALAQLPNNEGILANALLGYSSAAPVVATDTPKYGTKYLSFQNTIQYLYHYPALWPISELGWQSWAPDLGLLSTQTLTFGGWVLASTPPSAQPSLFYWWGMRSDGGFFALNAFMFNAGSGLALYIEHADYADRSATPALIEGAQNIYTLPGLESDWRHIEISVGGNLIRVFRQGALLATITLSRAVNADLGGRLTNFLGGGASGSSQVEYDDWFIYRHTTPLHSASFTPSALP